MDLILDPLLKRKWACGCPEQRSFQVWPLILGLLNQKRKVGPASRDFWVGTSPPGIPLGTAYLPELETSVRKDNWTQSL